MSSDRDRRALEIFESLPGLTPGERDAFVAEQCGADTVLRSRVDALLLAHPSATSFLEHRPSSREPAATESASPRLSAGERLGSFVIEERLGTGGMGEVYRARDLRLERRVAIKVLSSRLADDRELRKRLLREALAISQLTHPRICTLYDVGQERGVDFLVMELLEGETLARELGRGPLPLERALATAIEIAQALEYAHDEGFIHRDLKPGNVMRTRAGIKVLDFGLAKSSRSGPASGADPTLSSRLTTAPGLVLGTCAYMSPQQARGQPIDKQADIWAFGCVLYELITGRGAFGGETTSDVLVAVLEGEPKWEKLPATLPRRVRSLLTRCLQKDTDRRLRDIADARLELEECLAGESTSEIEAPSPAALSSRRRWLTACTCGVVIAAVSALVTWSLVVEPAGTVPRAVQARLSIVPRPGTSIESTGIAVSPDGSQVVYAAREDGPPRLLLRRLDDFESSIIPGTEGASSPFFSPNGRAIGFFASRGLFTVSLHGGGPVQVCDARGYGGAWSADDTIVYTDADKLWKVPAAGGTPALRDFDPEISSDYDMRWPSFLPGGNEVLVNSRSGVIRAVSLETGKWTEIAGTTGTCARYVSSGYLLHVREDNLYAAPFDPREKRAGPSFLVLGGLRTNALLSAGHYDVSETGLLVYVPGAQTQVGQLVWRGRGEGEAESPVEGLEIERYGQFRLSPDATRLAYTVFRPLPQVRILDIASARSFRLASEAIHPIWSPSGDAVYFRGLRDGQSGILRSAPTVDAQAERVVPIVGIGAPCSVSPDETTLLFFVDAPRTTSDDIWRISLDDRSSEPEVFIATPREEWAAAFSPLSGRWVAFGSGNEVFIAPFPEAQPRTLVSEGEVPIWSRNGDALLFRRGQQWLLSRITTSPELEVGEPEILVEGPYVDVNGYDYDYDETDDRFLFLRSRDEDIREIRVVSDWADGLRGAAGE